MTDSEKALIAKLADEATSIVENDGFTEEAKEIVQAIATLKQN